jgi:hypothetical protein
MWITSRNNKKSKGKRRDLNNQLLGSNNKREKFKRKLCSRGSR